MSGTTRDIRSDGRLVPDDWCARLLTPALVVDLGRVRSNVDQVIAYLGGDANRWRPHVKTTKIPRVFAEVARRGVRAFKCATTREADILLATLASEGIADADVLLAHSIREPHLARLASIAVRHPLARVSVLCEDPDLAASIPPAIGVFVDVNSGMHRTGLAPHRERDIVTIASRAGDRFRGVHWYDGHLVGIEPASRRAEAHAGYDRLAMLLASMEAAGAGVGEVVTAGTPTFRHAADHPGLSHGRAIHRVSPGTVVFHDARTAEVAPDLDLAPAAVVMTRVVSHPAPGIVTCDAGSKSVAAEWGDPCAVVIGHPEFVALTPNEEHLRLQVTDGPLPARGTILYLVPRHVCPTVNLADQAVLVDGARIEIVPVAARGHELLVG